MIEAKNCACGCGRAAECSVAVIIYPYGSGRRALRPTSRSVPFALECLHKTARHDGAHLLLYDVLQRMNRNV